MGLRNQVALITGGAEGLGRHLAIHLAGMGYQIIVFDIKAFTDLPCGYQDKIGAYYRIDLADISSLRRACDQVIHRHKRVDILVNNAAVRLFKNFSAFNEQEIAAYVNVNLVAPILLIKKFFPGMKAKGHGRIINIASRSAYWGYRTGTLYGSTKSALVNFTEAFGKELDVRRDNVTINAICPDSFSSMHGERFRNYDRLVTKIERLIEDLIASQRNAEVIPILLGKTKIDDYLRRILETSIWFIKY